jgi:hypothetical protein
MHRYVTRHVTYFPMGLADVARPISYPDATWIFRQVATVASERKFSIGRMFVALHGSHVQSDQTWYVCLHFCFCLSVISKCVCALRATNLLLKRRACT